MYSAYIDEKWEKVAKIWIFNEFDNPWEFNHFLGTSNWAKDYYTRTAGIGIAFESVEDEFGRLPESDLRIELLNVFNRDWNSPHCKKMK